MAMFYNVAAVIANVTVASCPAAHRSCAIRNAWFAAGLQSDVFARTTNGAAILRLGSI